MKDNEIVEFCRAHGACNVDVDGNVEVSFALDLLHDYFMENPAGCFETLREVFGQIDKIRDVTV